MIVRRRPAFAIVAAACGAGAALVAAVALRTAEGAHLDSDVFSRVRSNSVSPAAAVGRRALDEISIGSVALVLGALVLVALVRRRGRAAAEVVAIVGLSVGTTEILKPALVRFELVRAVGRGTWPSGHATVAASLALALVAAVPPRLKPTAAFVGGAYAAGIGAALVLLGWHLPSDVVGGFLVAGFWSSLVLIPRTRVSVRSPVSPASIGVAAAAVVAAAMVAAVVAAHHPLDARLTFSARSLVAVFFLFVVVATSVTTAVAVLDGEEAVR